ncbi:MAG: hypothetical protein IJ370_04660 [Oscillospiraceae bacterium]|nr:hypothetical protein [Oscillospiraceae bacterium]
MQAENKQFSELISAFDSSPLSFAILDSELHVVYTNKVLSERYPDIQNPVKLYLIFKTVDKPTILGYLKGGHSYEFTYDLPDQKGARITLSPLFDEAERFLGATALISSKVEGAGIFPADEHSECQVAVNRELRERITMMFTSIYAISHAKDFEPSPRVCEFLNNINQNCFQLLRVSDNLAKILRLSSENEKANFKLVDFKDYVTTLAHTIIRMDNKNRVPIEFVCSCGHLPARIDVTRMEFAITNILLNSIKYTRDGNRIKISLSRVGDNALLSISDSGAGIPKDILKKVGSPYFSYSHGEKFDPGFGIGLYITKQYVASHSGIFSIQSEEGVGTTVTISIPLDTGKNDGPLGDITLESPAVFEPWGKFSQTSVQLSEVCYYPAL